MKNDDQHCILIAIFWSKLLFCVDPQWSSLRHLARPEVPVQVRARRLREHEVLRGVVGAHPLLGPDLLRRLGPRCALVGARPAL